MELSIAKLCEVSFSHNYYSDSNLKNFEIVPTISTRKVLSGHKIFYRQVKKGFVLLSQLAANDPAKAFVALTNNNSFVFTLSVDDKHFLNSTDLQIDKKSDEIYYFSNRYNNVNNSELLLTSGTSTEYVSNSDKIFLRPQKFLYSGTSANSSILVQIKNIKGNDVCSENVKVMNGKYNATINLTSYSPSRYYLFIDGTKELDFFADSSLNSKNVFALIEIFVGDTVPASYRFFDPENKISFKEYSVKFNRRKTFWKYFVVKKYRTTLNPANIEIKHPDASVTFSQLSTQQLSDGDTSTIFVSGKELDLKEEIVAGIELKTNNGAGQVFIENLPNASIKNLLPDTSANKVYSEIFVYI